MVDPIALCLERLQDAGEVAAEDSLRYLSCTALPEGQPGLGLDGLGQVQWRDEGEAQVCSFVVDQEGRLLVVVGQDGGVLVKLGRAGRVSEVEPGRSVPLLQEDVLEAGPARVKLHLHGPVSNPAAPRAVTGPDSRPPPVEVDVRMAPPIAPPDLLERARRQEGRSSSRSRAGMWIAVALLVVLAVVVVVVVWWIS